MTTPHQPDVHIGVGRAKISRRIPPPGVVAGAVLHSARLSSGLSASQLAAAADVSESSLQAWEDGSVPLASVPIPVIERLEAALNAAGAERGLVADLAVAPWCDLVIKTIADSEDTSCLLGDPVAGEDAFRELLAWAVADQPPTRHQRYAAPGRLLPAAGLSLTAGIIEVLNTVRQDSCTAADVTC